MVDDRRVDGGAWKNGAMSNQSPFGTRGPVLFPVLPKGEIVASYETYGEAQQAVDRLAHADFPVKQVSIVGSDLKTVERVTGKLSYGRVALAGAASGAWLGIFLGLLMLIFLGGSVGFLLAAVLIGAGFGVLFGVVSYSINRRRKDFTSTMLVIASSSAVVVEPALLNRARNPLAGAEEAEPVAVATTTPVTEPAPSPSPEDQEPTDPQRA